jgi:hypothetical protein
LVKLARTLPRFSFPEAAVGLSFDHLRSFRGKLVHYL